MLRSKKKVYTKQEIAKLKGRALKLWKADSTHALELGKALLAVRAALRSNHGAFKEWWQKNQLAQSRVSYCMRLVSGKVGVAKAKRNSKEYVAAKHATQVVNKDLNKLFRACITPSDDKLNEWGLRQQLEQTIATTFGQAAHLVGWNVKTPEAAKAMSEFQSALRKLVSAVAKPSTTTTREESKAASASA